MKVADLWPATFEFGLPIQRGYTYFGANNFNILQHMHAHDGFLAARLLQTVSEFHQELNNTAHAGTKQFVSKKATCCAFAGIAIGGIGYNHASHCANFLPSSDRHRPSQNHLTCVRCQNRCPQNMPLFVGDIPFIMNILVLCLIWAVVASCWDLMMGFAVAEWWWGASAFSLWAQCGGPVAIVRLVCGDACVPLKH